MSALLLVLNFFFATPVASGPLTMAASTQKKILVVRIGGRDVKKYDTAVGSKKHATPMGHFMVRHIVWNPAWHPPDAKWAKGKTAKPPGHPDNPMKVVKIFFQEPDYYIHGTDDEESLGKAESHGCIRMSPGDVTRLAQLVMEHGGKPMPEPWYRRLFRRKTTKVVYLDAPVPIEIRS